MLCTIDHLLASPTNRCARCGDAAGMAVGGLVITATKFFHKVPLDFYLPRGQVAIVCSAEESRGRVLERLRRIAARQRIASVVLVTAAAHGSISHLHLGKPLRLLTGRGQAPRRSL